MRRTPLLSRVAATGLFLVLAPSPVQGQAKPPTISDRRFTEGSLTVTVTGSSTIDTEIAINTKASFAGGGSTWLQFGVSGAEAPNVLVT